MTTNTDTGSSMPAVEVSGLTVSVHCGPDILRDVSLSVEPGTIVGLVGESGSGKSTLGVSLLGFARPGASITSGSVTVCGEDLLALDDAGKRRLRGSLISYVPQDPSNSLNPSLRVGEQIRQVLKAHGRPVTADVIAAVLGRARLPAHDEFVSRFPHQLSGGQQQRLAIAVALACEPRVVVLDEPGLDVVTQARILEEVVRLRDETGAAFVYVTHDLAAVSTVADRVAVMYSGRIVEEGSAASVLTHPRHPYTQGLISSVPDHARPVRPIGIAGRPPGLFDRVSSGCSFQPRCQLATDRCGQEDPVLVPTDSGALVRCFEWQRTGKPVQVDRILTKRADQPPVLTVSNLVAEHRGRRGTTVAAQDVSFSLGPGECLALVGESGSGKSTVARCVAGLHTPSGGGINLFGEELAATAGARTRQQRTRLQIIFQDPYDSLNPRRTVLDAISWPARQLRGLSRAEAEAEVSGLLELVRLPADIAFRYPRELSGGQRQRVVIARALAVKPDVIICDEITSALDVSVQAAVLELLASLRNAIGGLSLLFITHDLGVVASIADRVVVLDRGRIVESGDVRQLLAHPENAYTQQLLASAPRLVTGRDLTDSSADTTDPKVKGGAAS
jgi:peptide/nickel transport system ATP-binding protein